MFIRILVAVAVGSLALLAVACGGDDEGDTPSVTVRTATPDDDETPRRTSSNGGDEKTPGPDETPNGTTATTPIQSPELTPASEGIPAKAPQDQTGFLDQFSDEEIAFSTCQFNPSTAVTDCDGTKYAVDPPLGGQDVSCRLGVVNGKAELINCTSQEPLTSIYYDIQE